MHLVALGLAALVAFAIIVIGILYISVPLTVMRGFGLPLPEGGANTPWWLRLKGVRDIGSGLAVLAIMVWSTSQVVGIILLALAFIPVGDMLLVLASRGSPRLAFGMHVVTAVVMVLAAAVLIGGVH